MRRCRCYRMKTKHQLSFRMGGFPYAVTVSDDGHWTASSSALRGAGTSSRCSLQSSSDKEPGQLNNMTQTRKVLIFSRIHPTAKLSVFFSRSLQSLRNARCISTSVRAQQAGASSRYLLSFFIPKGQDASFPHRPTALRLI